MQNNVSLTKIAVVENNLLTKIDTDMAHTSTLSISKINYNFIPKTAGNMNDVHIDPIDFFPGYDSCYRRNNHNNNNSKCSSFFTYFFVMVISGVACVAAFHYYITHYNNSFIPIKEAPNFQEIETQIHSQNNEILQELKVLNNKIEVIDSWRNHIDQMFTKNIMKEYSSIDKQIEEAIDRYDADKIGLFDYAAQYSGGSIDCLPETCPYPTNKSVNLLNLFSFNLNSNPENILQPTTNPGSCFAFYGSKGKIRIKLSKKIVIKAVTLDHPPLSLLEDPTSAPKDFQVIGLDSSFDDTGELLGKFTYTLGGRPYQTFPVENVKNKEFEFVELRILSNHGKIEFTCIYRFRVHTKNR